MSFASTVGCVLAKVKWNVPILIYAIVQFIAFLLVLVATPIDMYRFRPQYITPNTTVVTLWGVKLGVLNTTNTISSDFLWRRCIPRRDRFRLAQACAVLSIFVYGAAAALGFIMLYCCSFFRMVCVALNIVGAVTLCIVWAAVAVTYHVEDNEFCWKESVFSTYGAGFVLLLVAWVLDLLNIAVLLLPVSIAAGGAGGSSNRDSNKEDESSNGNSKKNSMEGSRQNDFSEGV
ncbi:amastin-like_surface_protein [Leishmania braziliensis MHOM/BR/75/M2904]|uniref:Amastin-like_surface_protein n=1 Tax=Leishmania braziliensis MHOM/BR/75/M2904 TaxID=420245 RepID=A0A3P3Z4C6_LEIBR|nr:amastin-like_surface_protein [Leishmania braziliensis MHOM/BR/75/M2904]